MLKIQPIDRPFFGVLVLLALGLFLVASAVSLQSPSPAIGAEESQKPQREGAPLNQNASAEQHGADSSPILVKIIDTIENHAETDRERKERLHKTTIEGWTVGIGVITTLILVIQTIVFGRQAFRLRQTVKAMDGQSTDMKSYIVEAARSADAMEKAAGFLKINADKIVETVEINRGIGERQRAFGMMQMRAYVCVLIGGASFQGPGAGGRFDAKPTLKNIGNTPANDGKYRIRAAILPSPLPDGFKFTLPREWIQSTILLPQQPVSAFAMVDDVVEDAEIENVKKGIGNALYVWGVYVYKDVFKITRRVIFAQRILFEETEPGKWMVRGNYLPKQNKAN